MLHMSIHVSTYVCVLIPTYLLEYCALHCIPPTIVRLGVYPRRSYFPN